MLRKTTSSPPPARCRFFNGAPSTGCTWLEFTRKPAGPEGPAGPDAGGAQSASSRRSRQFPSTQKRPFQAGETFLLR